MTNDYLPDPHAPWGHDLHCLALCAGDPRHVWQQNHCGVFYSANGAGSWTNVSAPERGVRFGFPIAVDDRDGKTAWVVPGQADSHRMAIDGGLFVARTETGNLFLSEDRGVHWSVVGHHLPPIYSVRWA